MKFSSVQKKWIYQALIALVFVFALGLRAYNLKGKNGMHIDEYWSFILSEYKDIGWSEDIPEGEYTVGELKAKIYAPSDPSFRGALNDVFRLWETNRDSPHTNLYYSALRLSLVGVEASDNNLMQTLIFRAGILNLLTFSAAFIAYFVFLRLLMDKRTFILLGLVVFSLNPFDIGNVLFFRPYMLQTLFVITFTSYLVYITKQIRLGVYEASWQNLLKFAFAMSLMLWGGYYSFIYGFFVGIGFILFVLKPCSKLNLVPFFFAGCLLAVAFDAVYYRDFFKGFYEYRSVESANNLLSVGENLADIYAKIAKFNLQWILCLLPVLLIFMILIYKKRHLPLFSYLLSYFYLIVSVFIVCLFISFISPVKSPRHLVSFMPIILVLIPLLLAGISDKLSRRGICAFIVLSFVFAAIFSVNINKLLNLNYLYNHYNNPKFTGIYRSDLPVYFTKKVNNLEYSFVNNGTRSFRVAAMDNDMRVVVSNIDICGLTEQEAFEEMRKNFDMPKEFILLYQRSDMRYLAYTCEDNEALRD